MSTESADDALVVRYQTTRDSDAFAEIVRRYREPVFQLALSVLGPGFSGEAEEVAQEVFLRVHHALPGFRRDAKLGTWIYRIAFNQALNLKARTRYRAPHLSYQALAEAPSPNADPLDTVQDLGRDQALAESMARLPEVYQSALRLYYWMDYSVPEIAALLGVPPNTVKSYLHRARHTLRALLEAKGYPDV